MSSVHLLVLVHGMWGSTAHLAELERIMRDVKGQPDMGDCELDILLPASISEDSTYDGVDWGGERVALEITSRIAELEEDGKKVTKFSITGYSLGGLISRYVVGILHQRGFFDNVVPVNFNTVATPHLGLPKYHPIFSTLASTLGPRLLSRTGEQFYCADTWGKTSRPLLEVMADPERVFYQGLSRFQHIRIYANAVKDVTVPYVTASISTEDPFAERETTGLEIELDETYSPIIKSYAIPPNPPPVTPKPSFLSREWIHEKKTRKSSLPPFLQFRFPMNIVFYSALPVLIPLAFSLILFRLSMASRSSRARIRALENDTSKEKSLLALLSELEKEVEEAVADIIDQTPTTASGSSTPSISVSSSVTSLEAEGVTSDRHRSKRRKSAAKSKSKSKQEFTVLTPLQEQMAESLNKLPIKKELAYFPEVHNSHAVVISRDVKRFAFHKEGEGVIRHWADSFIL